MPPEHVSRRRHARVAGLLDGNDHAERRPDDQVKRGPERNSERWNLGSTSHPTIAVCAIARRRFGVIVYNQGSEFGEEYREWCEDHAVRAR